MNREAVQLIAKSGLIPTEMLSQFYKWKMVDDVGKIDPPTTAQDLIDRIADALENDGMALVRETDIDIVRRYFDTQQIAQLVISTNDDPPQSTTFEVAFGSSLTGEIIFPWRGDSVANLMTNGLTHLLIERKVSGLKVVQAIYFCDVKEAYFGETKSFMICTPSTIEPKGDEDGDAA